MSEPPENKFDEGYTPPSLYDPASEDEEDDDLWFLPQPPEDEAPGAVPWPVARREGGLGRDIWPKAEAVQYQALIASAEAVSRYGERLHHAAQGLSERLALITVSALLRAEGIWIGSEQIALYRAFRLGTDDTARDLSRADWAVRRLLGGQDAREGVRAFLGRVSVSDPVPDDERLTGPELDLLGQDWADALLEGVHPLTRAAHGFALWRGLALTPYDQILEPAIAAVMIAGGRHAPFLPLADGHRFDRHALTPGSDAATPRLAAFYEAAEAGALRACMELDRLRVWQQKATDAVSDLSGRTPPLLIGALVRFPILSADLVADVTGCSRPSARRNLALFLERGLVREVTGQDRYRFWTAQT